MQLIHKHEIWWKNSDGPFYLARSTFTFHMWMLIILTSINYWRIWIHFPPLVTKSRYQPQWCKNAAVVPNEHHHYTWKQFSPPRSSALPSSRSPVEEKVKWPHMSQSVTSLLSGGWCMRAEMAGAETADHTRTHRYTQTQDWWMTRVLGPELGLIAQEQMNGFGRSGRRLAGDDLQLQQLDVFIVGRIVSFPLLAWNQSRNRLSEPELFAPPRVLTSEDAID